MNLALFIWTIGDAIAVIGMAILLLLWAAVTLIDYIKKDH